MANSDFRIQLSFFTHPKKRKLEKRLGKNATMCLIELWAYAASCKPDGVLTDMNSEDIEIAADWDGPDGQFVSTLIDIRFLNKDADTYSIHDWHEHNPYVIGAPERSRQSAKASAVRDGKKNGLNGDELDVFVSKRLSRFDTKTSDRYLTDDLIASNTLSPSPVPSPSPFPVPKDLPSVDGDAPKKKRSKPEPSDNKTRQITDCYQELYLKKFDKLPVWNGSTGKRTKELLKDYKGDADRICRAIRNGFDSTDPFIVALVGSFLQLTGASTISRLDAVSTHTGPRRAFGGGAV